MVQLAIFLMLAVVGIFLFAKFHNSKGIDKLAHDLTCEETQETKKTDELIGDAQQADEALNQRVDDNTKVVERIKKDTKSIKKHKGKENEAPEGGE